MKEFILIGYVAKAFGIKGAVSINLINQDSASLQVGAELYLETSIPDKNNNNFIIKSILPKNKIYFTNITSRTEAETLKGCKIFMAKNKLPELDSDEYYFADLIGAKIIDQKNNYLAKVVNFSHNGAQDLIIVEKINHARVSIPLVEELVPDIDVRQKIIRVNLPEGLLDLEEV